MVLFQIQRMVHLIERIHLMVLYHLIVVVQMTKRLQYAMKLKNGVIWQILYNTVQWKDYKTAHHLKVPRLLTPLFDREHVCNRGSSSWWILVLRFDLEWNDLLLISLNTEWTTNLWTIFSPKQSQYYRAYKWLNGISEMDRVNFNQYWTTLHINLLV